MDASNRGDDAVVGPTDSARSFNGPIGRFLELGGEHVAHNRSGRMWWHEDGVTYDAAYLLKSPRPYLKPAVDESIADGSVLDAYWRRWLAAQTEAL